MRSLIHLTIALFFTVVASCQSDPKYIKVDASEIEKDRLEIALNLSKNILSAQKEGGFYELSDKEATPKMKSGLDESLQKQSYQQIKSAFGEYQDLDFDHMMKPVDGTLYEIYRFKGKFNPDANVEVRAVLDAEGRLAGFFVKPWKDNL